VAADDALCVTGRCPAAVTARHRLALCDVFQLVRRWRWVTVLPGERLVKSRPRRGMRGGGPSGAYRAPSTPLAGPGLGLLDPTTGGNLDRQKYEGFDAAAIVAQTC
jgi:hypothetical protein